MSFSMSDHCQTTSTVFCPDNPEWSNKTSVWSLTICAWLSTCSANGLYSCTHDWCHNSDMFCLSPCLNECHPWVCLSRTIEFSFLQLMRPLAVFGFLFFKKNTLNLRWKGEWQKGGKEGRKFFWKKNPWPVPWIHCTTVPTVSRVVTHGIPHGRHVTWIPVQESLPTHNFWKFKKFWGSGTEL